HQPAKAQFRLPPCKLLALGTRVLWLERQDVPLITLDQLSQCVALGFVTLEVAPLAHGGFGPFGPFSCVSLTREARRLLRITLEASPRAIGDLAVRRNSCVDGSHRQSIQ